MYVECRYQQSGGYKS